MRLVTQGQTFTAIKLWMEDVGKYAESRNPNFWFRAADGKVGQLSDPNEGMYPGWNKMIFGLANSGLRHNSNG